MVSNRVLPSNGGDMVKCKDWLQRWADQNDRVKKQAESSSRDVVVHTEQRMALEGMARWCRFGATQKSQLRMGKSENDKPGKRVQENRAKVTWEAWLENLWWSLPSYRAGVTTRERLTRFPQWWEKKILLLYTWAILTNGSFPPNSTIWKQFLFIFPRKILPLWDALSKQVYVSEQKQKLWSTLRFLP